MWDDKAAFDQFYRTPVERWGHPNSRPGLTLHYHWWNIIQWQRSDYAPRLAAVLGLVAGDGVILVGCGFNGTAAGLVDLGIRVIGTDTSAYIHAEKGNTEEAEIRAACISVGINPDSDTIWGPPGNVRVNPLDLFLEGGRTAPVPRGKGTILQEELRTRGSRNSLFNEFDRQFPNTSVRYVITEEVLNSIPDNQAGLVCSYARDFVAERGGTVVHMLSPRQPGVVQAPELNWKTYGEWKTWLTTNAFPLQRILPTVSADGQGLTLPVGGLDGRVEAYAGLI